MPRSVSVVAYHTAAFNLNFKVVLSILSSYNDNEQNTIVRMIVI